MRDLVDMLPSLLIALSLIIVSSIEFSQYSKLNKIERELDMRRQEINGLYTSIWVLEHTEIGPDGEKRIEIGD